MKKKLETYVGIATIVGVIISAIALIPTFLQVRTPETPTPVPTSIPVASPSIEKIAAELLIEAEKWPVQVEGFDPSVWTSSLLRSSWDGDLEITDDNKLRVQASYQGDSSSSVGMIVPVLNPVTDFYLNVEAIKVSGSPSYSLGLLFRNNSDVAYAFNIYEADREYIIRLYYSEEDPLRNRIRTPLILPGELNRITVVAQGSHFFFYINGKYIDDIVHEQVPKGNIGLQVSAEKGEEIIVDFTSFELRLPEG